MDVGRTQGPFDNSRPKRSERSTKLKRIASSTFLKRKARSEINPQQSVRCWVACFDNSSNERERGKILKIFHKALKSDDRLLESVFERVNPESKIYLLDHFSKRANELFNHLPNEDAKDCLSHMPLGQALAFGMKGESNELYPIIERRAKLMGWRTFAAGFNEVPDGDGKWNLFNKFGFETQFLLAGEGGSGLKAALMKNFPKFHKNNCDVVLKVLSQYIGSVPCDLLMSCIENLPGEEKIRFLKFLDFESFKKIADGYLPVFDEVIRYESSIILWLRDCAGPHIPKIFRYINQNTKSMHTQDIFQNNNLMVNRLYKKIVQGHEQQEIDKLLADPQFFGMQKLLARLMSKGYYEQARFLLENNKRHGVLLRETLLKSPLSEMTQQVINQKLADDLLALIDIKTWPMVHSRIMKIVLTYSLFTSTEALCARIEKKLFSPKSPNYMQRNLYGLLYKLIEVRPNEAFEELGRKIVEEKPKSSRLVELLERAEDSAFKERCDSPHPSEESSDEVVALYCEGVDCQAQLNKLAYDIKHHTLGLIQKIEIEEFLNLKWMRPGLISNVNRLIKQSNNLLQWAKSHIFLEGRTDNMKKLHHEQAEQKVRGAKISFFIDLCFMLTEIGDFYSCFALYSALISPECANLKKSWKHVTGDSHKKLEQLNPLFDMDKNYRNLRAKLAEFTEKSIKDGYCFPINLISHELERVSIQSKWEYDHINYGKVNELSQQLLEFYNCRMKIPPKMPKPSTDFRTSVDNVPTRDFWRASQECEPRIKI